MADYFNILDRPTASMAGLTIGEGDNAAVYSPSPVPSGRLAAILDGTAAVPLTAGGPTIKVVRTEQITEATIEAVGGVGTDGAEQVAAIMGLSTGLINTQVQTVGVYGGAKTVSDEVAAGNDACGVYGVGRVSGTGASGTGIGGFLLGRRDVTTGRANGAEIDVGNYAGVAGAYNSTGFSTTTGLWVNATGDAESGVGIALGNPFSRQFEVGIGFNAQVNGGLTGPCRVNDIRVDDNATTAILINGTHSVAAMAVAANSGKVVIGAVAGLLSTALLEVLHNASSDPLVQIGSTNVANGLSFRVGNSAGNSMWGIAGGTNSFLTGSVAGDVCLRSLTTGKAVLLGGTTNVIEVTFANTLGFWNVTPVAQQATIADAAGGAVIDIEARAALNSLLAKLEAYGLLAAA